MLNFISITSHQIFKQCYGNVFGKRYNFRPFSHELLRHANVNGTENSSRSSPTQFASQRVASFSVFAVPPERARCTNLLDLYFTYSPINRRLRLNKRKREMESISLTHTCQPNTAPTSRRVYLHRLCRKFRHCLFRSHTQI